jgi:hypothetical protein
MRHNIIFKGSSGIHLKKLKIEFDSDFLKIAKKETSLALKPNQKRVLAVKAKTLCVDVFKKRARQNGPLNLHHIGSVDAFRRPISTSENQIE